MAWRDELQGGGVAHFRGVPFQLSKASSSHGRRNVDHQYPQRDRNFVEDMGRKSRPFNLVGFVVGDDYKAKLEACIAAAEQGGSGLLLHPYRGTLTVNCDELNVEESTAEGRMARVSWTFRESGDLTFPTVDQDTAEAARLQATATEATAIAEFVDQWDVTDEPGFVVTAAAASLQSIVDRMRAAVDPLFGLVDDFGDFTELLSEFEDDIAALVSTPLVIGARLQAIGLTIGNLRAFRELSTQAGTQGPLDATAPSDITEQTNEEAALRLQVQLGLTGAVTTITTAAFASLDDAEAARDELAGRINSESEIVSTDDLFTGLVDLRTVLVEFVDVEFQDLPALRTIAVPVLTPAVVLAWDLYADAERDAEIITRNSIQAPIFISPALSLSVLSS